MSALSLQLVFGQLLLVFDQLRTWSVHPERFPSMFSTQFATKSPVVQQKPDGELGGITVLLQKMCHVIAMQCFNIKLQSNLYKTTTIGNWDPNVVAVVDRWSFSCGHLWSFSPMWDIGH
jgi:hypothetical protein